jgi:hypothetical protein
MRRTGVVLAAAMIGGCTYPQPDAKLPEAPYVAVLSGQMPAPIDQVARHSWIVVQPLHGRAHRYELGGGGGPDAFSDFASGDVMLHGVVTGSADEIEAIDACLARAEKAYYAAHPSYFPIPGPNSNTLVASLDRACHLGVELPATAIGRDYVGIVGADLTEGRTGIQIGSIPFGIRLGLREGVGVQVFGLPLGVHLMPPGIDLPVNPGRIGFADESHVSEPRNREGERPFPDGPARNGAASVALYASGYGVVHPDGARGVQGIGLGGLSARVVYGDRVGYAAGFDLEMGASVPAGFAGAAHLYAIGVGAMLTPTGYVALLAGVGASGVTAAIPSGVELPVEARLELDAGRFARLALYSRATFVPNEPLRSQGLFGLGETTFGTRARFGESVGMSRGAFGSGYFFGLERRELMGTAMLGFVFGTEIDAGYDAHERDVVPE